MTSKFNKWPLEICPKERKTRNAAIFQPIWRFFLQLQQNFIASPGIVVCVVVDVTLLGDSVVEDSGHAKEKKYPKHP